MPKGNPDGLAVDETGGVWVALGSGGGIVRFTPQGHLLSSGRSVAIRDELVLRRRRSVRSLRDDVGER